jgi:hypothetical protein
MGWVERTLTKRVPMLPVKGAENTARQGPAEQTDRLTGVLSPGCTGTTFPPPG